MSLLTFAQYTVLMISYGGLALGYLPGLRMNRATIALVGSALLIGLGVLTLEEAWQAIDAETIVFLLSMMVVNANLAYAGFFELMLAQLLRRTKSPLGLLIVLTLGSGLLSAFLLNDTIAIVFTPLVLKLALSLQLNPIPYLLTLAAATNIGSVATINGNPQNILIGSFSQMSYLNFAAALTPVAVLSLMMQIGLLLWLYPEVRSWKPVAGTADMIPQPRIYRPLFLKSVTVTVALFAAFVIGLPLAESAFVAAALLLITRRIKPERVLRYVEWDLLVMFSGLFILTRCTQTLNLLELVGGWVSSSLGLVGVTTLLANVISNVPAVLLLGPLIQPEDTQSWLLLAMSSTLAGNLTLFGAVANLIVVEAAKSQGYSLTFWEHFRFGFPLTLLTIALGTAMIVLR
ncbi:MAG: anion transporter [Synechococcales cyanobacterium C42_A2020_086]|jgi:Na+/H+ antiporter NhaD/arsenite permease-like protein|nr:anion transporter [Synechococcales cyanobacterium C42_A2020_086]